MDNTGGTDWSDVELSLVAGAPQSFRQSISQPMYLRRPEVPLSRALLPTPQADAGAIATNGQNVVVDSSGIVLPGAMVQLTDESGRSFSAITDANGRFELFGLSGRLNAVASLSGFKTQYATFDAGSGVRIAMDVGSTAETVTVTAAKSRRSTASFSGRGPGVAGGVGGGVAAPLPPSEYQALMAAPLRVAASRDLGDLFEYKLKQLVSIPRNQSAMVPIVSSPVSAERVSTWNATDGLPRPRRALWITNTSGLTLDGGSVSVLDKGSFAGEGVVETIKAGERRLVSFALDLAMQVQSEPIKTEQPAQQIRIARGVMTVETIQCSQTKYTARNEDTSARQLIVEHAKTPGVQLVESRTVPVETTPTAWRFEVPVAAKSTVTLMVATYRSMNTEMQLTAVPDAQMALYARNTRMDEGTRRALAEIQAQRAKVAAVDNELEAHGNEEETITADQERLRDNMKALKGSAEEKQLLQRYVAQLNEQEDRLKVLAKEQKVLEAQRDELQKTLTAQLEALTFTPTTPAAACGS